MALLARDDAISDDWQDVDDDDLSVISLPTSAGSSMDCDDDLTNIPSPLPYDPTTTVSENMAGLSVYKQEKESSVSEADRSGSLDLRSPAPDDSGQDFMEQDAHNLRETLDVDMDPTYLHKVSTSLVKLISEILSIVHFRGHHYHGDGTYDARSKIRSVCDRLNGHLKTLCPILEGYSKHWNPKKAIIDLPIDPCLYEWMSNLNVELLGVQSLLQEQLEGTSSKITPQSSVSAGLDQHDNTLSRFAEQIECFIPVMESDYNEFHTANLPVVNDVNDANKSPSTSPGNSSLFPLRTALYSLKDQISACVGMIGEFLNMSTLVENREALVEINNSYSSIKSLLDVLLSNHASEWIEHGLAGGITYPEFCRLNPDIIRSLTLQLKDVTGNMIIDQGRILSERYSVDEITDEVQFSLLDLSTLMDVEDILVPLLRVKYQQ